jgi:hypothetical protein
MQDFQAEAKRMWKSESVRQEFNDDISVLESYLQNQHKVKSHTSKTQRFTKADIPADDTTTDDGIKIRWDADAGLKEEFGDYSTFEAYEKNKGRVRILNT